MELIQATWALYYKQATFHQQDQVSPHDSISKQWMEKLIQQQASPENKLLRTASKIQRIQTPGNSRWITAGLQLRANPRNELESMKSKLIQAVAI